MNETLIPKSAEDMIYLISCAVNNKIPDTERCKTIDLREVYYLSQAHLLTSAAAFALEKVTELPRPYDQAKKKAIHKLSLFDIERANILAGFEEKGVWYLPLKGILLKDFYPKAAMREMSDNDILFDSDKAEEVKTLMESMGYSCDMYDKYNHDTYSKPPTMEFEMHRTLFDPREVPSISAYFENIKEKLIKDKGNGFGYHMTDEDFYIYILCHLYKHYIFFGTGLRSLLDVYLFNKKTYGGLDKEYLSAELEKLEIMNFEKMIRNLAEKTFDLEALSEKEQKQLAVILGSGAYGTEENVEYNQTFRKLGGDDSKEAKRKYLLKRVFISGETLEESYPLVYKHKILYPLLFVYRPIKGLVRHPKLLVDEAKKIKGFKSKF